MSEHGTMRRYRTGCRCSACRASNAAALREYRAGIRRPIGTPEERFWAKVRLPADTDAGCWEWTSWLNNGGYGSLSVNDRQVYAHRFAYELLIGPIPEGLHLDHLCRNTRCVNPRHLEPVTPRENILRGQGIPVANAAKTHCKHGHPFTEANTYIRRDTGSRQCRACRRKRKAVAA